MPQGLVQPANSILVAGVPIIIEYEIGSNATECYPGRLIVFDTADYKVKEASSGDTGVMGVLATEAEELEATEYDVGDQAKVLSGPDGIVVKVDLLSGENATRGDPLYPADDGKVQTGAFGAPVGKANESVNAAGGDAEIMMRLGLDGAT